MKGARRGFGGSLVLALGMAATCQGQSGIQFRGPESGLLYDPPTRSVRGIAGLIGAARVGEAIEKEVDWAAVAPNGKVTLFRRAGVIRVLDAAAGMPAMPLITAEAPDAVLWGTESRSVLLVWMNGKSAQRVDLDNSGKASAGALQSFELEGEITAVAGTPNGPLVAAVSGRGVYAINLATRVARLLLTLPNCKALSVTGEGEAAWAVDGEGGVLLRIALNGDEQPTVSVSDPERLRGVTRIAAAPNGQDLLLANSETRRLYLLRAAENSISDAAVLDGPVTILRPMSRNTLYLLGHRNTLSESVQLYDDLRGDTVFVPFLGGEQ